ncbi:MAG: hypothetical protein Sw1PiTSA_23820 [Shewanella algae]|uniref:Uncharacterized protein n=1 Tax=Shewanella algae TaxID=38313 RepID=A0AAD1K7P2_9GAMM|nr:hypothetical protein TUM17378_13660 [Shewanella algae]BCV44331.1 hypothetical protein TUM17379_13490 [Shewanella algae]BCV48692.1 hypothetical protein TUM17382_13850 [Shewanella algae]BCV53096.1 hypothetical protein TUM17383_13430 [Shewanella algae]BCV57389.1 hypothetical protein TUM17384_13340 [Shewanella algae]
MHLALLRHSATGSAEGLAHDLTAKHMTKTQILALAPIKSNFYLFKREQ